MRSADGIVFGPTVVTERQPAAAEIGTIHVIEEGGRSCAYWCGGNDEAPTFLCAMAADTYNSKPALRQKFMELAAMMATGGREVVVTKPAAATPAPWWAELECAKCASPQAADVMHLARMATELSELALSPGGHPLGCCRVRTLAVMAGDPNAARSAAR
jgi:hypothetical protein